MSKLTYRRSQESPGVSFGWEDAAGDPIDFTLGWTFRLELVDRANAVIVSKVAGITGGVGQVDVDWSTGELDIPAGSYRLLLVARDESNADRAYKPANPPTLVIVDPAIGA